MGYGALGEAISMFLFLIEALRHTSVVVFGKEVFYGQGICLSSPGRSHHGRPLQVIDVGQTAIDEETFEEYLAEMRQFYTADKVRSHGSRRLIPLTYPDDSWLCFSTICWTSIAIHSHKMLLDFSLEDPSLPSSKVVLIF
jgi:hypothetical protein